MCVRTFQQSWTMLAVVIVLTSWLQIIAGDTKVASTCPRPGSNVRDFYWREYYGVIPSDAVPGGLDRAGKTTYIGQAMVYPWGQLPASIYQSKKVVASASRKVFHPEENIKILCSGSPDKFRWIPTDRGRINLISNCHLVLGGVDNDHQENIGRINYNEELLLGKVIRKPLGHDGLWVPDGETETMFTHYEVLGYNCETDIRQPFD